MSELPDRQYAQAIVDLVHERDQLRRENEELAARLRAVNPILVDNAPGASMATVLARVVSTVAHRRGVTVEKLRTGGKLHALVAMRNEAAWECRQVTPRPTLLEVARAVGLHDHSSAHHAIKQHAKLLELQPSRTEPPQPGRAGAGGVSPPTALPPALPAPADHLPETK